jgi:hypothetical protein
MGRVQNARPIFSRREPIMRSRPRYRIDLFALGAPLVNAMQFDADARVEIFDQIVHFKPGQIITDANLIALALTAPNVKYHIPGPIVIAAQAGGFAGDQITIAGTLVGATGDTVNVTINGHALAAAYTVVAADTFASIADAVARLINQDATDNALVRADAIGGVIQLTELVAGAVHTVTAAVVGGHITATVATASTAGFTAVVQSQEVPFTVGQVVTDPSMIGVVAQNQIPYALQAGVAGFAGF